MHSPCGKWRWTCWEVHWSYDLKSRKWLEIRIVDPWRDSSSNHYEFTQGRSKSWSENLKVRKRTIDHIKRERWVECSVVEAEGRAFQAVWIFLCDPAEGLKGPRGAIRSAVCTVDHIMRRCSVEPWGAEARFWVLSDGEIGGWWGNGRQEVSSLCVCVCVLKYGSWRKRVKAVVTQGDESFFSTKNLT